MLISLCHSPGPGGRFQPMTHHKKSAEAARKCFLIFKIKTRKFLSFPEINEKEGSPVCCWQPIDKDRNQP